MQLSNFTLVKIAAIGGFATACMGYAARGKIEGNIKSAPFYKEALKMVRAHPAAVHLLGEPIKEGTIDVAKQKKNFIKGNNAHFVVPLRGSKQKGHLFVSATKQDEDQDWSVGGIELEVADRPDKRLIIKDANKT